MDEFLSQNSKMDEFLKQVKGTNAVIVTGITDKFSEFAKSANPDSDGKTIDLETVNKWLKMAFLENTISATDVLDKFEELKMTVMDPATFLKSLTEICNDKKLNTMETISKLLGAKSG